MNNGQIDILAFLDNEESKRIRTAAKKLSHLWWDSNFIAPVQAEYNSYLNWFEDNAARTLEVERLINNYLGAYKGFIDKWETYLKRNKPEEFFDYYDELRRNTYDTYFEYRLIYNLRNFGQHNGHPVTDVSKSLEKSKLLLDKEYFLKEHRRMQSSFRKELEKVKEETLDVDNAIRVVYQQLWDIQTKMFNKFLNGQERHDYLRDSATLLEFYKSFNQNQGELSIVPDEDIQTLRERSMDENVKLSMTEIPYDLSVTILKSVYLKFKFKGSHIGISDGFPVQYKPKLAVAIPPFKTGQKYVLFEGVQWIRIMQSTGLHWRDGYNRYFAVYYPEGLSLSEYSELAEKFEDEQKELFS
ncbi:hypothetical protein ACQ4XT_06415 [Halobacillus faecis]